MIGKITADDSNILYSPYNWYVTSDSAKTICSGAYLKVFFEGTPSKLCANFDVSNMADTASKLGFRIDGGTWRDYAASESIGLTLPANNTWEKHVIEMVVVSTTETVNRWNDPQDTAVIFTGITADADILTMPLIPRALYGVAIGDSITEGIHTLNKTAEKDTYRNDSRLSWAYPLIDNMGAEIGIIGFGGIGITKWGSGGIPKFCDSIPYYYSNQPRNFSDPRLPDFVVCNIGTNDGDADNSDVIRDTTSLLNYLIGQTKCPIIVFAGWRQIQAAAIKTACEKCSDSARITYLDTTDWLSATYSSDSLHLYGYANISNISPRLAKYIRGLLQKA